MQRRGSAALILAAALVTGCQNKPKTTPPPTLQPVPTEQTASDARAQLQRVNPGAEVGTVLTVYRDLAAVTDVDPHKFSPGTPITFLDGNMNDLTMGHVLKVIDNNVQIQFDPPTAGHREPRKGDLAVYLASGTLVHPVHPAGEASPTPVQSPSPEPTPPAPGTNPATEPSANPAESPKPDAPKPDAPAPDAPKPDAPKPDAPAPDAPKPDASKPDAPKPDAPAPDAPKPDTPKPDAPAPDAPKPDAPKPDVPKDPAAADNSKSPAPSDSTDQKPDQNK